MKIVHIHTDHKFVDNNLPRFIAKEITNTLIFIGNKEKYKGKYQAEIHFIPSNRNAVSECIHLCAGADIVVLYNLDNIKSLIANKLPENIIIIWRFFGNELYGKLANTVYTESTLEAKNNNNNIHKFRNKIRYISFYIKHGATKNIIFKRATLRCDYFMGLSEKEHDVLNKSFHLPKFLQISFASFMDFDTAFEKKPFVILGNNRSPYNNHIDLLNIISSYNKGSNVDFKILFNYGAENKYTKIIRDLCCPIENVELVEDYMSKSDFVLFYNKASAFVLNGKRQMAMGNIHQAIRSGVKIYLNIENPIYDDYIAKNFHIYSMNDFTKDIETNNITLSKDQIIHNQIQYQKMTKQFSHADFQKKILSLVQT